MAQNLPPETIYQFIVADFEGAWDSLASNPREGIGRGNFMFARQAMTLLEFAARLCPAEKDDPIPLKKLSDALQAIEPKYFTKLPGKCFSATEFKLPYDHNQPKDEGKELLWALFDLIRNGQAHQNQQIPVNLGDKTWFIQLRGGADMGQHLKIIAASRPTDHLEYQKDQQGDLWLIVHPGVLFLDLKYAIQKCGLLTKGLSFKYFERPKTAKSSFYQFTAAALENHLASGGHRNIT